MALKERSMEPLDLDVDLTQVDTSMPVLVAGLKDLKVHDIVRAENSRKDGFNLEVILITQEEQPTIQNVPVKAGFPLKTWLPLQAAADAADPDGWKKGIASFIDACLGTKQGTRPSFSKAMLLDKVVRANVVVEPYDGRPTNKVKAMTHPV